MLSFISKARISKFAAKSNHTLRIDAVLRHRTRDRALLIVRNVRHNLPEHHTSRREMYTSSRTWVSPRVKENGQRSALNFARRKLCPNSPFWSANFDVVAHKQDWEAGRTRNSEQKMARDLEVAEDRQRLQNTRFPVPPHIRPPFDGKEFETNHSAVLCYETIFSPYWEKGKEKFAAWPSKSEAKYEGDDRISTDRLHGRFPGAPRVEGNETVSWQHRGVIEQFPFDDFYYPIPQAVEIFLRTYWVAELEISDEEGHHSLGKDLMEMLDLRDQW